MNRKERIDKILEILEENGGSMARLNEEYLIMTPNSSVKISN